MDKPQKRLVSVDKCSSAENKIAGVRAKVYKEDKFERRSLSNY